MKNLLYIIGLSLSVLMVISCDNNQFDDESEIITTEDAQIDALLPLQSSYLYTVLGLGTKPPVNFTLVSQSIEGIIDMDAKGNITVLDESTLLANVKSDLIIQVKVSKNGVEEMAIITVKIDYRDTDGDGVIDFDEIANTTDLNNPCDPIQDIDYDGYNSENEIWREADCDGDGLLNGEEVDSNTNPYDPCIDNVNTSLWEGSVSAEDVDFPGAISVSTTSSCRVLEISGDWTQFLFDPCADGEAPSTTISFEPTTDGAIDGTVFIEDQPYALECLGEEQRIKGTGVYNEEDGVIRIDYEIYYVGFEDEPDWFGTIVIKPEL